MDTQPDPADGAVRHEPPAERVDGLPPEPATATEGKSVFAGVASNIAGVAGNIAGVAGNIAGAAGPAISAALSPLDDLASGARRAIGERSGARVRRVRRMGQRPLANLWEEHPEARRASIRELGLKSIPVEQIAGTAVEGPTQRGGDFLPLRDRRGEDWRARWQRIRNALDRLENLPPIELIKFGDQYWVVDGHNRVGAALYNGQVELDAVVEELRLPGMAAQPREPIASVLEGSLELRNAGAGRRTHTHSPGRPEESAAARRTRRDEPEHAG